MKKGMPQLDRSHLINIQASEALKPQTTNLKAIPKATDPIVIIATLSTGKCLVIGQGQSVETD